MKDRLGVKSWRVEWIHHGVTPHWLIPFFCELIEHALYFLESYLSLVICLRWSVLRVLVTFAGFVKPTATRGTESEDGCAVRVNPAVPTTVRRMPASKAMTFKP